MTWVLQLSIHAINGEIAVAPVDAKHLRTQDRRNIEQIVPIS